MASIVRNQQLAYLSRAQDDARRLASSLASLNEPQRAAMLAFVAAKSETPVDIVMIAEPGDWRDAHQVISAHLRETHDHRWEIGSGCHLVIEEMPR